MLDEGERLEPLKLSYSRTSTYDEQQEPKRSPLVLQFDEVSEWRGEREGVSQQSTGMQSVKGNTPLQIETVGSVHADGERR